MHEVALAQDLVSLIERVAHENGARQVTVAVVELGELSAIMPDALNLAFSVAIRDTIADGCRLVLKTAALVVQCKQCSYEGAPAGEITMGCPKCGNVSVKVVSGRQMRLVSIDVEDDNA